MLPDFDNWANKYVVVTFDDNPTREHAALAGAGAVTQQGVAGMLDDSCSGAVLSVRCAA